MAAGDRGARGRREYSSGDRRRGSRYRDRKTAEKRREEYESSGQAAKDAQRKKDEAARREKERQESERRIREAQEKRQREEAERKAREEAEKKRKQEVAAKQQTEEEQRRAAVTGEEEEGRGLWDRLTSLFSGDEEEGEKITDDEGNVVAEAFTVDEPTKWSSLDFGEGVGYEEPEEEGKNVYEGYGRSVMTGGSIGPTEEEKEVQRRILAGGEQAMAADAASVVGGIAGGPIGAGLSLAGQFGDPEEGSPEEAGKNIYEGGKTGIGTAGSIASSLGVPGVGAALNAADIAFGSAALDEFRTGAGLPGQEGWSRPDYGSDNGGSSSTGGTPASPTPITTPSPTPAPTMADSFQMADWDQNLYSKYLQQFFNQGA